MIEPTPAPDRRPWREQLARALTGEAAIRELERIDAVHRLVHTPLLALSERGAKQFRRGDSPEIGA